MAKKAKKKTKNTHKEKRGSSGSQGTIPVQSKPPAVVVGDGVGVVKGNRICYHIEKGVDLSKISGKIGSKDTLQCEECRESLSDRKGRSKLGKKGKGGLWVCLQCGHVFCGGVGLPTTHQCHAIRHSKQSRHPCVIQLKNPSLCWCFPCNSPIPVRKAEGDDSLQNDILLEVSMLIKGVSEGSSIDVEDVCFGSGSVEDATMVGTTDSLVFDRKSGYVVRGLSNLGNTCFFNSVMQNLLAMDQLYDFFMKLDHFAGPMTMALKKLFNETNFEPDSKYGINPRNLFGCICSKSPQFRGYQQQDSHELLRCLLDGLCTEELNMRKSASSPKEDGVTSNPCPTFIDGIFGGQLSSTVSCMECKHSSVVYEPFLDLSLPIPSKKPPSKKASLASRSMKTKLPLKHEARKGRQIRGKGKKDSAPVLVPCALRTSETINSSSLVSDTAHFEDEQVGSIDSPLDNIRPDTTSSALDPNSHKYDSSPVQISENKRISQDDGKLQNSSESQCQVVSTMIEAKQNSKLSKGSSSENDLPLLQASEAVSVPCNEESSTGGEMAGKDSEVSSSLSGRRQDALDFVGFRDILIESEMDSVPILDDKNSQRCEATQTGFLAGNNSESDRDEVDDRDAPLSINTCLAYFTKSELLSEHAWHCENCSKTLRRQQKYSGENLSETTLKRKINGVQLQNQNDTLEVDLLNSTIEPRSSENCYPKSEFGSTIEGDRDLMESSFDDQASVSCSVNDHSMVKAHESSDSDDGDDQCGEGIDNQCVKVMTNATKRILINKAPQILTIHLKRFRQDSHGRLNKLSGHVIFHDKIDVSPYLSPRSNEESKPKYQLLGVVEHSGTMRGGHYIAYVRGNKRRGKTEQDSDDRTWFYASDSHVHEVSVTEVFNSEAYILFYEKI